VKAYDLTGSEALDYRRVAGGEAFLFASVATWLYANTRKGMAAGLAGEVERLLGRRHISMERYIADYRSAWQKA
jgi:hypothetical protein